MQQDQCQLQKSWTVMTKHFQDNGFCLQDSDQCWGSVYLRPSIWEAAQQNILKYKNNYRPRPMVKDWKRHPASLGCITSTLRDLTGRHQPQPLGKPEEMLYAFVFPGFRNKSLNISSALMDVLVYRTVLRANIRTQDGFWNTSWICSFPSAVMS